QLLSLLAAAKMRSYEVFEFLLGDLGGVLHDCPVADGCSVLQIALVIQASSEFRASCRFPIACVTRQEDDINRQFLCDDRLHETIEACLDPKRSIRLFFIFVLPILPTRR